MQEGEKLRAVRLLRGFTMMLYDDRNNKASTIASKLSAINFFHKAVQGVELPIMHPYITTLKRGLKRTQSEAGSHDVKLRMQLTWPQLLAGSKATQWGNVVGGTVMWYSLALSYWLLCRASELFAYDAKGKVHEVYCLRRSSLSFSKDGVILDWSWRSIATHVHVTFAGSKADQMRKGATIKREGACVQLINELLDIHPALQQQQPLTAYMTLTGPKVMTRTQATRALRVMLANIQVNDCDLYALHSGRIGAASQLWNHGGHRTLKRKS